MGKMERPREVKRALYDDDRAALRAMAKKAGKKSVERADLRALEEARKADDLKKNAQEQAKLFSLSPEGDVLPPDPNATSDEPH